jgi:hypothetical protein
MPSPSKPKEGVLFSGELPIKTTPVTEGLKEVHTGYTAQPKQEKEKVTKLKEGLDAFIVEEGQGTLG